MDFRIATELGWSRADQGRWKYRMAFGRRLNRYIAPARETEWNSKLDGLRQAVSPLGRMSDQERGEVEAYLDEVRDSAIRAEYFRTVEFSRTLQYQLFRLVSDLLGHFQDLRSVTNVGAYFAYVDWMLAKAFPSVQFTALDLVSRMEELNAPLEAPNLSFRSGYALDLLERHELSSDVVCFSATAAEIKNRELHEYATHLRKATRYLVLSEPIYSLPGGGVCDPLSLRANRSVPAYIQPDSLPHRRGPISYVHNYRAILEASGFEILHYHARKLEYSELRWLDVIAVPRP